MNKKIKDLGKKIGKTAVRHCGRSEAIQKNSVVLSVFSVVLCETKKYTSVTQSYTENAQSCTEQIHTKSKKS